MAESRGVGARFQMDIDSPVFLDLGWSGPAHWQRRLPPPLQAHPATCQGIEEESSVEASKAEVPQGPLPKPARPRASPLSCVRSGQDPVLKVHDTSRNGLPAERFAFSFFPLRTTGHEAPASVAAGTFLRESPSLT